MSVAEKQFPELYRWQTMGKERSRWWTRQSSHCRACCPNSGSTCVVFMKLWLPVPLGSHLTPRSSPTSATFWPPDLGDPSVPLCGHQLPSCHRWLHSPLPSPSSFLPSLPPPQFSAVPLEGPHPWAPIWAGPHKELSMCLSLLHDLFTGDC